MLADQSTLRPAVKYSGINISILWTAAAAAGYSRDRWLTYNQANEVGAHVRRGQKGTCAILYRDYDVQRKDATGAVVLDENGNPVMDTIKLIKGFSLFNVEQCEWIAARTRLSWNSTTGRIQQPGWNPHAS